MFQACERRLSRTLAQTLAVYSVTGHPRLGQGAGREERLHTRRGDPRQRFLPPPPCQGAA